MNIKLRAWALLATGLLHLALLAWCISPRLHQPLSPAAQQLLSLRIVPAVMPKQEPRPQTLPSPARPAALALAPMPNVVAIEAPTVSIATASEPAAPAPQQSIPPLAPSVALPEPVYQPARPPGRACAERGLARHYPKLLRERGIEGQVLLKVRVDEQGQPAEIRVADGSGWRLLDEAARLLTQGCRFVPARRGEQTLASWIEYPVRFALNDATQ